MLSSLKRRRTVYDTSIFYDKCISKEDLNISILSNLNSPVVDVMNIDDFNDFLSHLKNVDSLYLDIIKQIKNYPITIKFNYSSQKELFCHITLNNITYKNEKIFKKDLNIMKNNNIPITIKIKSCLNFDPCIIKVLNKSQSVNIYKLFELYEKFYIIEYNNFMQRLITEIQYIKKKVIIHDIIKNIKKALTFNPRIQFLLYKDKNYVINEINKEYIKIINILLNPVKVIKDIFNKYDLIEIYKSGIVIEYNEFLDSLKMISSIQDIYREYEILHHNINIELTNIINQIVEYIDEVISTSNFSLFEEYKKIKSCFKDTYDVILTEKMKLLNDMKL